MHFEYKYLISCKDFETIRGEMLPYLSIDDHAKERLNNEYTVRSLYLDTHDYRYYFEKIEGIKCRKKLRIRAYNEFSEGKEIFLEIKRKDESRVFKQRARLLLNDLDKYWSNQDPDRLVIKSPSSREQIENARNFKYYVDAEKLSPTVLISYEREPYYYKFDRCLRITFDKNLRYLVSREYNDLFTDNTLQNVLREKIIIEIKFVRRYPDWLISLLQRHDLQRNTLSKYTICIDHDKKVSPLNNIRKLGFSSISNLSRHRQTN